MSAGWVEIVRWIQDDSSRMAMLRAVSRLSLPDCWIGAGFVRNLVWDRLHGHVEATPLNDIDVLYFDPQDLSRVIEQRLEARLRRSLPGLPWSIRNQARMHRRNNDASYRSTCHALTFWAETPTAVAVAIRSNRIAVIAPFGTEDLMGLTVRPTPRFRHKMAIYRARVASKNWLALWPRLTVLDEPRHPSGLIQTTSAGASSIDLRPRNAGVGWVTR